MTNTKKPQDIPVEKKLQSADYIYQHQLTAFNKSSITTALIIYISIGLFVILLFWVRFSVIDEFTIGEGKVVPSLQVQKIQSLEGGLLKQMLIAEGDIVKKGQVIAILEDTQFAASLGENKAKYFSTLATIARLQAEANGNPTIEFPTALKTHPELISAENAMLVARYKVFNTSIQNLQQSYDFSLRELKITEPLVKQGVISTIELLRLKRETNDLKTKIDDSKDKFHQDALAELSRKNIELAVLAENLKSGQDRVLRTIIHSPVNGIVKQIFINTIGGVIKPGMDIVEIVPTNDSLMLEVKVKPTDIAFIHPGQKAVVRITAYDYTIYGGLQGVVSHISADTNTDKDDRSYYEIFVKTDKAYLGNEQGAMPIIPGMLASVDVLTGKRTVLAYLLKPILRAKTTAFRER